jgi:hypothetical protein
MLVIVMGVATWMFPRPARDGALMQTIYKHHRTACGIPSALGTEAPNLFNCQRRSIASRKCSTRGGMTARRSRRGGTLRTLGEAGRAESG